MGIALLKNEEYFTFWSIASAVEFCDEFIVVDNESTDRTPEKVEVLRAIFPRITVHRAADPNTSHRYVEEFAGKDVWVFGVDGDEVYDPEGLARLRPRILGGEFDAWWRLDGHMLHAASVDLDGGTADGFSTPSSPSGTKLFNFRALESWREPARERLHGHSMQFRRGWSGDDILRLFERAPWDGCDLRCLHLCFFPRTSIDDLAPAHRPNPSDLRARGIRKAHTLLKNFLARPFSRDATYKTRRYRRGPLVTADISAFGRPGRWSDRDPQAEIVEAILSGTPEVDASEVGRADGPGRRGRSRGMGG